MRMSVAPGSLWIAYTITSHAEVQSRLPPSLVLAPCSPLADDVSRIPSPKLFFNVYHVDAKPIMYGMRADVVTLARHRATGVAHLVVLDCLTNTLQWDPERGIRGGNARFYRPDAVSRRRRPDVFSVGMHNSKHVLAVRAYRERMRPVDWTFAVQGNRACYFGSTDYAYAMAFNETDIARPVRNLVPCDGPVVNTFWSGVRSATPSHLFCHEHPMHFDVDVDSFV